MSISNNDVLQVCADMLRRADMTAGDLASHMGTPSPAKPASPLRADGVLARADCATGLSSAELQCEFGLAESTSSALLTKLLAAGRLHRLKLPGEREIRWFASGEAAQAYLQDHMAVAQEPDEIKAPKAPKAPKPHNQPAGSATAGSSKVAPAIVGAAIIPDGLVIQRSPRPLGRYEVAPGEAMSGGFMAEWQAKRAGTAA